MTTILSILAILALAGTIFLAGCKNKTDTSPDKKPSTTCTGKEVTVAGIKSLHKCQVEDLLREIEKEPANKDEIDRYTPVTAMCYKPSSSEESYNCPKCGMRTSYGIKHTENIIQKLEDIISTALYVKEQSKIKLDIDTSELCAHCHPNLENRYIKVVVTFADGSIQKSALINADELRMLSSLSSGKSTYQIHYKNKNHRGYLKNAIPRLREILGLHEQQELKEKQ